MQAHTAFTTPPAAAAETVRVEVLTGLALVNGAEIALCQAHRLLVCALARCRHPVPREQLQAMMWPDEDLARSANLLSIAMHRLRKRLGDAAIVQSAEGYRLGDAVVLDLWEIETFATQLRATRRIDDETAARWLPVFRRVCCGCERTSCDPEFVGALERRMRTVAREITDRVAEFALQQQHPQVALDLVRVTLDADPCDEAARELAIRAHVALGDRAAAIREYRDYARALTDELGLAPSFTLSALVA